MRRDVATELKALRLLGMAGAWTDLLAQGESQIGASKWLIEHLLQAEHTDRAMRSINHQMKVATQSSVCLFAASMARAFFGGQSHWSLS